MNEITVKKVPGAAEDLLLDASEPSTVMQVRGKGEIVEVTKINAETIPYAGTPGEEGFLSIKEKIGTAGQYLGNPEIPGNKAVMFMSQTTDENLVLEAGTNGLVIGELTFEDGGSITLEDGTTLKVV